MANYSWQQYAQVLFEHASPRQCSPRRESLLLIAYSDFSDANDLDRRFHFRRYAISPRRHKSDGVAHTQELIYDQHPAKNHGGNVATSPPEAFGLAVSDMTKELIEALKGSDSIEQ